MISPKPKACDTTQATNTPAIIPSDDGVIIALNCSLLIIMTSPSVEPAIGGSQPLQFRHVSRVVAVCLSAMVDEPFGFKILDFRPLLSSLLLLIPSDAFSCLHRLTEAGFVEYKMRADCNTSSTIEGAGMIQRFMQRISICLMIIGVFLPLYAANASPLATIEACYFCGVGTPSVNADNFFQGVIDGPIFRINNVTASPLTNVVFKAAGDFYSLGTLAGNSSVVLTPGISDDGALHASGAFWRVTGVALDTSESGPDGNDTAFELSGLFNGTAVTTGTFTPASSIAPAIDNSVALINFLGGPSNKDIPCNSGCYGPRVIATVEAPVPLPGAFVILASGLSLVGIAGLRSRSKNN